MAEELGLFGEEPGMSVLESVPDASQPAPAPAPAPAVEPAPEPAKVEEPKGEPKDASPAPERVRDPETGRFKPREGDEPQVPLSALTGERDRRQAAEKALKEAQDAKPKPDIWADPEAFVNAKLAEREPQILAQAEEKAKESFFRYTEGASIARHSNDAVKYEQARDAFVEAAKLNPMMVQKLRESSDPGEFIYSQGVVAMQLKEVGGDLNAYRTRIETEVRQKLEAEAAARKTRDDNIPVSLNSEPSKGAGVQGHVWSGPTPDENLFPER